MPPSTQFSEAALAKRAERQRHLEGFPGRLPGWEAAVGKRVAAVAPVPGRLEQLGVAFTDGSFLLTRPAEVTPEVVETALEAMRRQLEPRHAEAFAALDRLRAEEAE